MYRAGEDALELAAFGVGDPQWQVDECVNSVLQEGCVLQQPATVLLPRRELQLKSHKVLVVMASTFLGVGFLLVFILSPFCVLALQKGLAGKIWNCGMRVMA